MVRLRKLICVGFTTAALVTMAACASPQTPKRGVIEQPIDEWGFRRYQQVLDIEVWVPKTKAVAYTASYVRKSAEKRGRLSESDIVNAFVTHYEPGDSVAPALIRFTRRLARESGYAVEESKRSGQTMIAVSGHGEAWLLWASTAYIVKLGGPGITTVPKSVMKAYAERYPSSLKNGALDAPLEEPDLEPTSEPYDPKNPTPQRKRLRGK